MKIPDVTTGSFGRMRKLWSVMILSGVGAAALGLLVSSPLGEKTPAHLWIWLVGLAAIGTSGVALARDLPWARFLAASVALSISSWGAVFVYWAERWNAELLIFLAGPLLLVLLVGRETSSRYSGKIGSISSWAHTGMGIVRAALMANFSSFLTCFAFLPLAITSPSRACVRTRAIEYLPLPLVLGMLLSAVAVAFALVLLARLKTAGLLLLMVANMALPMLVMHPILGEMSGRNTVVLLLLFGPAVATSWIAFMRWLHPIWQSLRHPVR